MLSATRSLVVVALALTIAACTGSPVSTRITPDGSRPKHYDPAEGEGDGAEGEGSEGEGDGYVGEGEEEVPGGDIDIDASSILSSVLVARADTIDFIDVTVTLIGHDGAPVVGRAVTFLVGGSAHTAFDPAAVTDIAGKTSIRISADVPGDTIVAAEMPDGEATARLGDLALTFEPCLSIEDTLVAEMWSPVFSRCVGCHNDYGLPITDDFGNGNKLVFPGEPDFAERNLENLRALSFDIGGGVNYLVAKPTAAVDHLGGQVIAPDSPEAAMLTAFAARLLEDNDTCGADSELPADRALATVDTATPKETYARAKMALLGAPLSAADDAIALATEADLSAAIDALLADNAVSNRVVEIYNDWLWTDRFTREVTKSTGSANLLLNRLNADFPQRRFFFQANGGGGQQCDPATDVCCGETNSPYPGTCEQPVTSNNAADSLAREPLELVRHIWKNDLSANLIATADFTMVNPYTAILYGYGKNDAAWTFDADNTNDRNEFRVFHLKDNAVNDLAAQPGVGNEFPHAGILTTHAAMMRFPATTSNRERRRSARIVYERFLGIDVMKLADFSTAGLPPDADLDTATRSELACTACHSVMDPVARTLFSFGENGEYLPNRGRPPANEMYEASFMGERFCNDGDNFCSGNIAGAQADARAHVGDPVRWLVERVVQSPRFPYAMVLPLFSGLTGAPLVRPPPDLTAEEFAQRNLAFNIQNAYLTALAQRFDADGRNLKKLAKDILMGPFFRGAQSTTAADSVEGKALALAGVGRGTLISPEQLSRKVFALTGEKLGAADNTGNADFLRDFDEYRLLFGGVNWESLTIRFRDPNPVMMRVVERMADQVACRVVVEDFARKDPATRKVFAPTFARIDATEGSVRAAIATMRLRLLGEDTDDADPEVSALYDLFVDAKSLADAATDPLPSACRTVDNAVTGPLADDPDGSVRAWMAVTSAVLSDPLFFVE